MNVFVDGRCLEYLLEHTTGKEFRAHKSYTLTPIYAEGAFHPKMMLLVGQKQGLLAIGSGNLTGSGICSNDEIWGALHVSTTDSQHINVFAAAWEYLLSLQKQSNGFIQQSIEWIKRYSPWINRLVAISNDWSKVSKDEELQLLINNSRGSIMKQLRHLLPKTDLEKITVISPFYDIHGHLLSDLQNAFKPKSIDTVVQTELGSLPEKMKVPHNLSFYEWTNVIKDAARLHAKMFHFHYSNGSQFLLFGSANATIAAFGGIAIAAKNEEACLLIKTAAKPSYLQLLGIKIPKISANLQVLKVIKAPSSIADLHLEHRIIYVQIEGPEMSVHFETKPSTSITISVLDADDDIIQRVPFDSPKTISRFHITEREGAFKIAVYDGERRTSNFQVIHRVDQLIKNNPDPDQEKLDISINEYLSGERDDYIEILNHLSYNWADEDESQTLLSARATRTDKVKTVDPDHTKYEKLSSTEFNNISQEILFRQKGILTSTNLRIADFFGTLSGMLNIEEKESFEESEESKQLHGDGYGEGQAVKQKRRIKTDAENEQRSIFRFYNKLVSVYDDTLKPFYQSKGTDKIKLPVTISSLSNIIIGLDVFQLYYGKKVRS